MKGRRSTSGTKRKALGNSNHRKQQQDSSFLAKLQMLRAFVTGFDESDLSSCLRQCGYNVELAAERLMTGQYKPSPLGTKTSFFSDSGTTTTTTPKTPSPSTTTTNTDPQQSSSSATTKRPRVESARKATTTTSSSSSMRSPNVVTPKQTTSSPTVCNNGAHLLLCQRWLVGISASRARQFSYKEPLQLTSTQSGPPMVRFRGKFVEGTLPLNLSTMLAPLLRCQEQTLISLSAEALMEERNVQIGADVPLSLSVYIEDPCAFFELFETAQAVNTKEQAWLTNKISQSKKKLRLRPLAEAAFGLLQWAQYGDVLPKFEPPKEQDGESKDPKQLVSSTDKGSTDDDDDEEEEEDPIVLREDEFETEGSQNESSKNSQPEWADSVVDESTSLLPEADEPEGLAITLRPYQKQALHWMIQRENTTMESESNRESLENELKLLAELNKNGNTNTSSLSLSSAASITTSVGNSQDVVCECGPVHVSDKAAKRSATLGGMVDPVNHPLWQRRFLAKPGMKDTISFYVNELVGVASGETPNPPRQCVGGLLADAMGLGKTVMLVSLILKDKQKNDKDAAKLDNSSNGATLVVAPLSLITQWEEEIATKTNLTARVYYGDTARSLDIGYVDVVITTYGTVQQAYISSLKQASAMGSSRSGTILSHNWRRVILDEAHGIKNPQTAVSKACCTLKAEKRWCITGTPIQNSLQDVYGLLKFLKHEPWCEGGFWKAAITSAITQEPAEDSSTTNSSSNLSRSSTTGLSIAIDRVRRLLAPLILRRTKDTLTKDGKPILTLPPVETKLVNVEFTSAEREFYNSLLEKSQSVFDGFIESGTASKSWFAIFSLLQRLRQACDHVALTVKSQIDQSDWKDTPSSTPPDDPMSPKKRAARAPGSPKNESSSSTTVDEEFLEGLLDKFRRKQSPSQTKNVEDPSLDKENVGIFSSQVAHSLSQAIKSEATNVEEECPICLDNPKFDDAVITPCAHIFCRDCLVGFLRDHAAKSKGKTTSPPSTVMSMKCPDGECPCCNKEIKANRIIAMSKNSGEDGKCTTTYLISDLKNPSILRVKKESPARPVSNVGARQTLENALKGAESSKLAAVIDELHKVWELDPGSKVIVFSQFLGFLSLLEVSLRKSSIPFNRLDGKMSLKERVAALEKFNRATTPATSSTDENDATADSSTRLGSVLLVSMKAGGVGLNLVAASSVFILDPWWNAAVEDQCVDRIHRIGQTADVVRVRKFVIQDSVEERIIELQRKKKDMASDILSDANNNGEISNSRPTLDDFKLIFGK